tara:strand:+ start:2111 stop:2851 length:741 start_codon:yes stop_codon:yes gene_type:complete
MNGKVTIQLQHHSPAEVIEWDRQQYEGTEYENSKYGTFKPWGLYLAEPLAYMNWRYESHATRNRADVIEWICNDELSGNWLWVHTVKVKLDVKDIYFVRTRDDLPKLAHGAVVNEEFIQKEIDMIDRRLMEQDESGNYKYTVTEVEQMIDDRLKQIGALDAWKDIQKKYKAVVITSEYFENDPEDPAYLHMPQLIVFDTTTIVDDITTGERFNFVNYGKTLGYELTDDEKAKLQIDRKEGKKRWMH